jgi:hypothetical protein
MMSGNHKEMIPVMPNKAVTIKTNPITIKMTDPANDSVMYEMVFSATCRNTPTDITAAPIAYYSSKL